MFVSTKENGQTFAFPDTCKVPAPPAGPIPMPFPNMGMCMQATGTCPKVTINNQEVIVVGSKIPQSAGDEAGVAGGVVSGMTKGEIAFRNGSSSVKAGGKNVARLLSQTAHNGSNANAPAGMQIAPSQPKVLALK